MNCSKRRHDGAAYRRCDTLVSLYCRPCKDRTKARQTQQHKTHIERKAKPLDTDKVTLSLWSVEDFNIL